VTQRNDGERAVDSKGSEVQAQSMVSTGTLQGRAMTPLWVIALFISLTETVLGVAATRVSGNLQIALTVFVIGFPLLIAGGFFAILWFRPYVLYPPTDFRGGADVTSYVDAMQHRVADESRIHALIEDSLSKAGQKLEERKKDQVGPSESRSSLRVAPDVAALVHELAKAAIANVDKQVIRVDTRPITGTNGAIQMIPYSGKTSMYDFLTGIFYSLADSVKPFTYGEAWALRNDETFEIYVGAESDSRVWMVDLTLERSVFRPGMRLSAVYLRPNTAGVRVKI
jgi:hypothetical protein